MEGESQKRLPTLEEFRDHARRAFGYLAEDFGFREEPLPLHEDPYLNQFAVWFVSPSTWVVVEGIHYGMNARVALGRAGPVRSFENYDLGDLLAIRRPEPAAGKREARRRERRRARGGQLGQLGRYATALREVGEDVLRGDHTIFPALAARVEWRRAEFAAGRDPRT